MPLKYNHLVWVVWWGKQLNNIFTNLHLTLLHFTEQTQLSVQSLMIEKSGCTQCYCIYRGQGGKGRKLCSEFLIIFFFVESKSSPDPGNKAPELFLEPCPQSFVCQLGPQAVLGDQQTESHGWLCLMPVKRNKIDSFKSSVPNRKLLFMDLFKFNIELACTFF